MRLTGVILIKFQQKLYGVKIIIIDKVSIMVQKIIYIIYRCLLQESGKESEPFGGFSIIFVGYFQQLPPVGDRLLYEEDGDYYVLFYCTENVVQF